MKKRIYNKRAIFVFGMICCGFCLILARIAFIASRGGQGSAVISTEKTVLLEKTRGYIYDRNMLPLVNAENKNGAAIITSPDTKKMFSSEKYDSIKTAGDGLFFYTETEKAIPESDISVNIKIINRYSSLQPCVHIIGYTDASGHGVCGIEKSFDRIFAEAGGSISAGYSRDAFGRALLGEKLNIHDDNYDCPAGVVLTIDKRIQLIAEEAMRSSGIGKGACVIICPCTGELLAVVSLPEYDIFDLSASLDNVDSPFLNRALNAYPVGSVFKPFIAAAAIENGVAVNGDFECEGYYDANGTLFHCYNRNIHGKEGINEAICNSCNCYFIDVGIKTGAAELTEMCSRFGFGKENRLTSCIIGSAGALPENSALEPPAALANFCFGQGELLATPLQLCAAYSVFASGGIYNEPYITKYLVDENKKEYAYYAPENSYRVLDRGVCGVINNSLLLNMSEGTGKNGAPENVTAAGKTATAQTGKYDENGEEKLCTWFCGFFPFEKPEYCVCIFNEEGASASEDCAPVFKKIAEKITAGIK